MDNRLSGKSISCDIFQMYQLFTDTVRSFMITTSAILGAIILISIVIPWFLVGVACIMVLYLSVANFYRASAREMIVSSTYAIRNLSL